MIWKPLQWGALSFSCSFASQQTTTTTTHDGKERSLLACRKSRQCSLVNVYQSNMKMKVLILVQACSDTSLKMSILNSPRIILLWGYKIFGARCVCYIQYSCCLLRSLQSRTVKKFNSIKNVNINKIKRLFFFISAIIQWHRRISLQCFKHAGGKNRIIWSFTVLCRLSGSLCFDKSFMLHFHGSALANLLRRRQNVYVGENFNVQNMTKKKYSKSKKIFF